MRVVISFNACTNMYLLLILQLVTAVPTPAYNWHTVGAFESEALCMKVGAIMGKNDVEGMNRIICVPMRDDLQSSNSSSM